MINYSWTFLQFEVLPSFQGLSDVVSSVQWRFTGIDADGYSAEIIASTGLEKPDPITFSVFEDITEEQTKSWVESSVKLDALKAGLDASIADARVPRMVVRVPPFKLVKEAVPEAVPEAVIELVTPILPQG